MVDRWIKLTRGLLIRERVRRRFSHHECHQGDEEQVKEEGEERREEGWEKDSSREEEEEDKGTD